MRYPAEFDKKKIAMGVMGGGCNDSCSGEESNCAKMMAAEEGETKKWIDDEDDDDDYPLRNHSPPDGGFSWIVSLAAFFCLAVIDGSVTGFSVLGPVLYDTFDTTEEATGWVGSSLAGVYLLTGPVAAVLVAQFGCKRVAFAGSIITCIGFLLSSQSKSVTMMILTYGVIGGFGCGLIYLSAVVAVGHWFDKKRALATGFAFLGSSVGVLSSPHMTEYLLSRYDWDGVLIIQAGVVLNCAVAAMLFIPVDRWKAASRMRKAINHSVEVVRGDIMKALIENKKRERCISNGSLDNAVITRDNRLIKLAPQFFEGKRNNSFIARVRRQLGFSSQTLASSKSSLANAREEIPKIVIDAFQREMSMKAAAAATAAASGTPGMTGSTSLTGSPIYRPNGVLTRSQHLRNSMEKRGSVPNTCGSNPSLLPSTRLTRSSSRKSSQNVTIGTSATAEGFTPHSPRIKTHQSCDVIPKPHSSTNSSANISSGKGSEAYGGAFTRSASDLGMQIPIPLPMPLGGAHLDGSELSIQSIQLLPNGCVGTQRELAAKKAKGLRCRSSRSESSTYSFGGFSYVRPASSYASAATVLYGSEGTLQQIQASVEEIEEEDGGNQRYVVFKCANAILKMMNYQLLLNPRFCLFALSIFAFMFVTYIPFFYMPRLAMDHLGFERHAAYFLLVIIGVTNMLGKIIIGWLADRPKVPTLLLFSGTLVAVGVALCFTPFCETEKQLAVIATVFGVAMALTTVLRSILLVEFFGLEQLTESFGLISLFQGVAVLIGAPIAGKTIDMTGSIYHCFYLAGALMIVSGLLLTPIFCLEKDPSMMKTTEVCVPCSPDECGGGITETLTMEQIKGMETSKV